MQHQFLDDLESRMNRIIKSSFERTTHVLEALREGWKEQPEVRSTRGSPISRTRMAISSTSQGLKAGTTVQATLKDGSKNLKVL